MICFSGNVLQIMRSVSTTGLRVTRPADGVCRLTIDGPATCNALDRSTVDALIDTLGSLADDAATRVVILTGAEGFFSAGANFGSIDLRDQPAVEIESLMHVVMQIGPLLHALPQPTIAAIDGPAAGAGLSLALACDLRIAGPTARFLAPFIHMGLIPDCGATWLLPRIIGEGPALELMLTGHPCGADKAHRLGLVTHLAEDPTTAALDLARIIGARPPDAVRTIKRLVRDGAASSLEDAVDREAVAQALAFSHPDFGARLDAWRASRRPEGASTAP